MPGRQASRILWLVFSAAFVLLAWQFQDRLGEIFSGRGVLTVLRQPDQVVLRWRGDIRAPLAAKLAEAFHAEAANTKRFLISLHSPGGSLQEGRDAIVLMRRMQRTHEVDTVVESRRVCASMCVAVYLAGNRRTASPNARFMFHEVSFRDSHSDKVERVPKAAIERATDQFFDRYLKPGGVDARWLAEMREAIRGKEAWRTAEQLVAQRAGVVHELE